MVDFINPIHVEQFAEWLHNSGLDESAIKDHLIHLRQFGRWYLLTRGQELTPENASEKDLTDYKKYLWGGRQKSKGQKLLTGDIFLTYFSAAKSFIEWAKEASSDLE